MGCCYPTIIGKDFLLWFFAVVISSDAKMLQLKMGLRSLRVYYVSAKSCKDCYPTTIGKNFFNFFSLVLPTTKRRVFCILQVSVTRCMVCYPTTIGKDFLLWIVARSPVMKQKWTHLKWVSQV